MNIVRCVGSGLFLIGLFSHFEFSAVIKNETEALKYLEDLEYNFRKINGLDSPLLGLEKTKATLKRLLKKGEVFGEAQFFKDVSEGARIYFGLYTGELRPYLPAEQKELYRWCHDVISFVYATSFFQRPDHEGPTEALFVVERATKVIKPLLDAYFMKVLGSAKRLEEFNKRGVDPVATLIEEFNKKMPSNSLGTWTGADKTKGIAYGAQLHFRSDEKQTHRDHLFGRFKALEYGVQQKTDNVILEFRMLKGNMDVLKGLLVPEKPSDDPTFNLGIVPSECKETLKTMLKNVTTKDQEDFQTMQRFLEKQLDNKELVKQNGTQAQAFQSYLRQYSLAKGLTHLKKIKGTERYLTEGELLVYSYFMRPPLMVSQEKDQKSLSSNNKVLSEYCIARGLFLAMLRLQDAIRELHKAGVVQKLGGGESLSSDLNSSMYTQPIQEVMKLSEQMNDFCTCCQYAIPLIENVEVQEYFERARKMISTLLTEDSNNLRYVLEQDYFDSDCQTDFFNKKAEQVITEMVVEFNTNLRDDIQKKYEIKVTSDEKIELKTYGIGLPDKKAKVTGLLPWERWLKELVKAEENHEGAFWTELKSLTSGWGIFEKPVLAAPDLKKSVVKPAIKPVDLKSETSEIKVGSQISEIKSEIKFEIKPEIKSEIKNVVSEPLEVRSWAKLKKNLEDKIGENDDRIALLDATVRHLLGADGERCFVKETNAFVREINGSKKLFESQCKANANFLEAVSKVFHEGGKYKELRGRIENFSMSWRAKVKQISQVLEKMGFIVSFGPDGARWVTGMQLSIAQRAKNNQSKYGNTLELLVNSLVEKKSKYNNKFFLTLGKAAFIERITKGYEKTLEKTFKMQSLKLGLNSEGGK